MKHRKNFHKICVNNKQWQYCVSTATSQLIIYDENDHKYNISYIGLGLDFPKEWNPTWRGKNGDHIWGTREVAFVIKTEILKEE